MCHNGTWTTDASSVRGSGADVVIAEEFAAMNARAFAQICLPLAQLDHVALWAITTMPTNAASEFNAFLQRRDAQGAPLFRTFIMSLVCDACRAAGVSTVERCPHVEFRLPPWISMKNVKKVKALMGPTFEEEAAQELTGVESTNTTACFRAHLVDEWMMLPRVELRETLSTIFVSIDPNAGEETARAKPGSNYALTSFCHTFDGVLFLGVENINAQEPEDYVPIVLDHVRELRRPAIAARAKLVVIHENNMGMEAGRLRGDFRSAGITGVEFVRRSTLAGGEAASKTGLSTTSAVKRDMASEFRIMLNANQLRFARTFITHYHGGEEKLMPEIERQAKAMRVIKRLPPEPFQPIRIYVSGKEDGDPDDIMMSMMLGVYWSRVYRAKFG